MLDTTGIDEATLERFEPSVGWRDDRHLNEGMLQLVDRVADAWPAVTDAEFEARTARTCKSCGSSWRPAR
jgi:hypothetical protein